jgi:hypothetical protein
MASSCPVAVAERLVAAGCPVEARFADVAEGPLAAWLERRPEVTRGDGPT